MLGLENAISDFLSNWGLPSLKLTFSHLKMDGWNTIVSFWGPAYFQVLKTLVSGRVALWSGGNPKHVPSMSESDRLNLLVLPEMAFTGYFWKSKDPDFRDQLTRFSLEVT